LNNALKQCFHYARVLLANLAAPSFASPLNNINLKILKKLPAFGGGPERLCWPPDVAYRHFQHSRLSIVNQLLQRLVFRQRSSLKRFLKGDISYPSKSTRTDSPDRQSKSTISHSRRGIFCSDDVSRSGQLPSIGSRDLPYIRKFQDPGKEVAVHFSYLTQSLNHGKMSRLIVSFLNSSGSVCRNSPAFSRTDFSSD